MEDNRQNLRSPCQDWEEDERLRIRQWERRKIEMEREARETAQQLNTRGNSLVDDVIASETLNPKGHNQRRSRRENGRTRQRNQKYRRVLQRQTREFLADDEVPGHHGVPQELLEEISSDSDENALPAETIAAMERVTV